MIPEVGKWYYINYRSTKKRSFKGAAKCVETKYKDTDGYAFVSPLNESETFRRWMFFKEKDIKGKTAPMPTYKELYDYSLGQTYGLEDL